MQNTLRFSLVCPFRSTAKEKKKICVSEWNNFLGYCCGQHVRCHLAVSHVVDERGGPKVNRNSGTNKKEHLTLLDYKTGAEQVTLCKYPKVISCTKWNDQVLTVLGKLKGQLKIFWEGFGELKCLCEGKCVGDSFSLITGFVQPTRSFCLVPISLSQSSTCTLQPQLFTQCVPISVFLYSFYPFSCKMWKICVLNDGQNLQNSAQTWHIYYIQRDITDLFTNSGVYTVYMCNSLCWNGRMGH